MKTIVTHIGPDLDAITSVWLIKTYMPGWEEAAIAFVPAGSTLNKLPPDDDPEVIHVDTGFGRFDHHQTDGDTCAAILVYNHIFDNHKADPALIRITAVVNQVDHFREAFFSDPTSDYWDISIMSAIDGWRLLYPDNPIEVVVKGMSALDGIYKTFQNKIWAEREIKDNSVEFESRWGKCIALETTNDEVVHQAQKMGYQIAIRKDPKKGYIRIKALPKPEIDLEEVFKKLKSQDPEATWFLHASHHMILNGSAKNPDMKPTKLNLDQIIEVFKNQG